MTLGSGNGNPPSNFRFSNSQTACLTEGDRGSLNASSSPLILGGERSEPPYNTSFNQSKQLTTFEHRLAVHHELIRRGMTKEAGRYISCGQKFDAKKLSDPALRCEQCGHLEPIVQHCNTRICPECSIRIANRHKAVYAPILLKYFSPKNALVLGGKKETRNISLNEIMRDRLSLRFMTLTVKNVPELTKDVVDNMKKVFRRFRRQKKVRKYVYAGLSVLEVTEKGNGWHPHFHVIYFGKYFPNKEEHGRLLTECWQKACRGLFETEITDVRPVKNLKKAFNELIKYCGKGSSIMDPIKEVDFLQVMKGRRLLSTWGFKEKIGRKPKMVCPECGACDWTYLNGVTFERPDMNLLSSYIKNAEAFS